MADGNSREQGLALGRLREQFQNVPMVALTATADPQTRADILQRLGLSQASCHAAGFDR